MAEDGVGQAHPSDGGHQAQYRAKVTLYSF